VNVNIEFKNLPADEKLRKLIDRLIGKLERKLARLGGDAAFLRVMLEENGVRRLYRVSVNLELPKKTLTSQEQRHDADESIRDAFAEIERQIEARKQARKAKNFAEADRIRQDLAAKGIILEDGPQGTTWKKV